MNTSATVVLDSLSPYTHARITTLSLVYPRIIHGEFMTHRAFSRNAMSSRAVPVSKMMEEVQEHPFVPKYWGANQPGMQAGGDLPAGAVASLRTLWLSQAADACEAADAMMKLGLHKQIANRLLEPFQWMRTVVTSTEWDNFFKLRCHPAAEPHIQELAFAMREAMDASAPELRDQHFPYLPEDEVNFYGLTSAEAGMVSAARCARVSYRNHDGSVANAVKDLKLAQSLADAGHASPFEHVAEALREPQQSANFKGWRSMRSQLGI